MTVCDDLETSRSVQLHSPIRIYLDYLSLFDDAESSAGDMKHRVKQKDDNECVSNELEACCRGLFEVTVSVVLHSD